MLKYKFISEHKGYVNLNENYFKIQLRCEMKEKKSLLDYLVYIGLLVVVLIVLFFNGINYACKNNFLFSNVEMLLICCILVFFSFLLSSKLKKKSEIINENKVKRFLFWICICAFQILFCYLLYFYTGWDAGWKVIPTARNIGLNLGNPIDQAYFSRCPNNIVITLLYASIFKIGSLISPIFYGETESVFLLICFQCLLSTVSGYLLAQIIKELTHSKRIMNFSIFCYLILVGFSPWLIIPYSDATGLIFPIVILRLYQLLFNKKYLTLKLMGITFFTYWGYKIKPQTAIIFIAIVMVEIIKFTKKIKNKEKINLISSSKKIIASIGVIICSVGFNKFLVKVSPFELNKEAEFGMNHYFMMGLNNENNGIWCRSDAEFSESFSTREERNSQNLRIAKERIEAYGVRGLAEHIEKKTLTLFNDGSFAFGMEGDFYVSKAHSNSKAIKELQSIFLSDGEFYIYSSTIRQFVWISVLCIMLFSAISRQMDSITRATLFSLAGITLFELLFEARARYLFIYVPFFIILAAKGLKTLSFMFNNYRKNKYN